MMICIIIDDEELIVRSQEDHPTLTRMHVYRALYKVALCYQRHRRLLFHAKLIRFPIRLLT